MSRNAVVRSILVSVAVVVLASCGSDSGGSAGAADVPKVKDAEWVDETGESTITIDTKDNSFTPEFVKVSPGTEIVFDNRGRTAHNVIPSIEDQFEAIPVDELQPADKATLVLDEAGEYPYYCSLHGTTTKGMIGSILVEEG